MARRTDEGHRPAPAGPVVVRRARAAVVLALAAALVGGCSLIGEEAEPAVETGLALPPAEGVVAAVDDAAEADVWGETTTPAETTAPPAPPSTDVDPRHAFAQAGAQICTEELGALAQRSEPVTFDEKVEAMRRVADAFLRTADRLAGLAAPTPDAQGQLDEAVRLLRRASELMGSIVDVALQGDQAAVDARQAELQTVIRDMGRAVTGAGIPSCR